MHLPARSIDIRQFDNTTVELFDKKTSNTSTKFRRTVRRECIEVVEYAKWTVGEKDSASAQLMGA